MAFKKLEIKSNKRNILIAKDDMEEIVAAYKFDTVKDIEDAINDLGWFKDYSKEGLLDETGFESIAEIADALANDYATITSNGGENTLEVVQNMFGCSASKAFGQQE